MKFIRVLKAGDNNWYKEYYTTDNSSRSLFSKVKNKGHFEVIKALRAKSKYASLFNDHDLYYAFIVKDKSGNILVTSIKNNNIIPLEESTITSLIDEKMKDYEWKNIRITTATGFKKLLDSGIGKTLTISSSRGGGDYAKIDTKSNDRVTYYISYDLAVDMVEKFNLKLIKTYEVQEGRDYQYSLEIKN